jgi:hypothetical protein
MWNANHRRTSDGAHPGERDETSAARSGFSGTNFSSIVPG